MQPTLVSVELLGVHPGVRQDLYRPRRHIGGFVQGGPKGIDEDVPTAFCCVEVLVIQYRVRVCGCVAGVRDVWCVWWWVAVAAVCSTHRDSAHHFSQTPDGGRTETMWGTCEKTVKHVG